MGKRNTPTHPPATHIYTRSLHDALPIWSELAASTMRTGRSQIGWWRNARRFQGGRGKSMRKQNGEEKHTNTPPRHPHLHSFPTRRSSDLVRARRVDYANGTIADWLVAECEAIPGWSWKVYEEAEWGRETHQHTPPPPTSTLVPYTTLFRSGQSSPRRLCERDDRRLVGGGMRGDSRVVVESLRGS